MIRRLIPHHMVIAMGHKHGSIVLPMIAYNKVLIWPCTLHEKCIFHELSILCKISLQRGFNVGGLHVFSDWLAYIRGPMGFKNATTLLLY